MIKNLTLQCSYELFWSTETSSIQKCKDLTLNECSSFQSLFDYFSLYWCHLDGDFAGIFFLILFMLPLVFKFLSYIKNETLFPSTIFLLEWIKCPKTLASLTILPFVNTSIEFFLLIVASKNQYADSYNFSLIYGEIIFSLGFSLPILFLSHHLMIRLNKKSLIRDLSFLSLSTLFWIIIGALNQISITISLIYLFFYIVYIIIIGYQSKNKLTKPFPQTERTEPAPSHTNSPSKYNQIKEYDPLNSYLYLEYDHKFINRSPGFFFIYQNQLLRNYKKESMILQILEIPFFLISKFTIPPVDPIKYRKLDLLLWPIPGLFFIYWSILGTIDFYSFYIIAPIAVFLEIFFLFTAPESEVPNYYPIIQIIGWGCSAAWLYRIGGFLIDTIQFIAIFTNLDHNFFGFFLLGLGLSLQVLITGLELLKKGERIEFLIISTLFSQVFSVIIVIAITNLVRNAVFGNFEFLLFNKGDVGLSIMLIGCFIGFIALSFGLIKGKMVQIGSKTALGLIIGSSSIVLAAVIAGIVKAVTSIN